MTERLIIFGTGDFSDVLSEKIDKKNYDIIGYCVEKKWMNASEYNGKPIYALEDLPKIFNPETCNIIIGIIGHHMFEDRKRIFMFFKENGFLLPNFISNSANIFSDKIGVGNIFMENVVVEKHCSIGDCNIFWPNVVLPHHNKVGSYNNLSPSVSFSGYAEIEDRCFIGNNACLNNKVIVHSCALVGAGVFVRQNLQSEMVLVSEKSYILDGKKSYDFK